MSILIPAYNPDKKLVTLVESLIRLDCQNIIIVNDGSKPECLEIFNKLSEYEQCKVLHHSKNQGKGRALKTGFEYFYENNTNHLGIVTADADGQHLPKDIEKIARSLEKNPNKLILGSRTFPKEIPLRSLFGNILTRYLFSFLIGKKISDTQTGLRGISKEYVPILLNLHGEGYEYEINMLISTKRNSIDVIEEEIDVIYINNNESSHFNPLIDSMKIYFVMFRFFFSSFTSSALDFLVFSFVFTTSKSAILSFISARLIASVYNFTMNRRSVFHDNNKKWLISLLKYYALLIMMTAVAYYSSIYLVKSFDINIYLSKIIAEGILFFINFIIQREFIFVKNTVGELRSTT